MYRYIVIDDEALIRKGIVKKIAALDMPLAWVGEAEDGEKGLELALKESPDIVLTDMRMPAMDGVSLLHALFEHCPGAELIVISGYSDFEYTREAIATNVSDYILKPFNSNELRASLDKAIARIREKELKRQGDMEQALELELGKLSAWLCRSSEDERPSAPPATFQSAPIRALLSSHSLAVGLAASFDGAECRLTETVEGGLPLSAVCLELAHPERADMTILVHGVHAGAAQSAVVNLQSLLAESQSSGECFAGAVSSDYHKPIDLPLAYREALSLLENRPFGQRAGLYQSPASGLAASGKRPEWKWARKDDLLYEIEEGHVPGAVLLAEELFDFCRQNESITLAQVKHDCLTLIHASADRLGAAHPAEPEWERRVLTSLQQALDPFAVERHFVRLVKAAAERVLAGSSKVAGQMQQIKNYISLRYSQPIRLEEVAERFYLHPVYLSMVFKESTGETFQDYLKRLRMERAKQLLSDTKYRVDRIASMIGYENTKYFYKVFKKESGYTPAEYRRQRHSES